MKKIIYILVVLSVSVTCCKKSEFLDTKPDNSQIVPETLEDCQNLLDNDLIINGANTSAGIIPALGMSASDDYFVKDDNLQYMSPAELNQYIWATDPFLGAGIGDWNFPYKVIFYANQVIDLLQRLRISGNDQARYNNLRGQALFQRAYMYFSVAQIFTPVYDKSTASSDWGLPIRLNADINEKIERSTVQQTYDRIITDLQEAISLLPDTAKYKTRASKVAGLALLAKVYQTMQDYDNALIYSNQALQIKNELLDFNTEASINTIGNPSFSRFNKEVLYHAMMVYSLTWALGSVDTSLYKSYDSNDLRKDGFVFKSGEDYYFVGSYDGTYFPFAGLATDEVYLIRAESYARTGNTVEAMKDLNALLSKRWKSGSFVPYVAANSAEALKMILTERRKELVYRGTRWADLRRLNKEGANINLLRRVNGQTYSLQAGDKRYVYPIPPDVISFNPTMPQNAR